MIVDYHMHLRAPDESILHTAAAVAPYAETAAARGVDEIGITEHVYYFRQTRELWSVAYQVDRCTYDLDAYVDAVLEAKRGGLPVKLGLEVDLQPRLVEETAAILEPYPWDYLLGSVHFVDGFALDSRPALVDEVGAERAWRRYFEWLNDTLSIVDVLAHPDLIKFFGTERPAGYTHDYEKLVANCKGAGVALEISTAGLYKPHGRPYPEPELLEVARAHEVGITLASDAHVPALVGRDFDRALDLARGAGHETVTVFDRREARQEPLG
jgi:histidinol-phosphatase (PHP family)